MKRDHMLGKKALRQEAARQLGQRGEKTVDDATGAEARRLLHELQVHQIELELQKDELEASHAALEESLQRFERLYEDAPVGYMTLDGNGRILRLNACAREMLDSDTHELRDTSFQLLVSPGGREAFSGFLEDVLAGRPEAHCEFEISPPGGPRRFVGLVGAPIESEGLANVAMFDLSERHRMQLRLEAEHTLLARAEAICHMGSWHVTLPEREISCSDEMLRICGAAPGKDSYQALEQLFDCTHPDDRGRVRAALESMLEEGTTRPLVFRVVGHAGSNRWIHMEGDAERDDAGHVVAVSGFALDITDRVEAERRRLERVRVLAGTDPMTGILNRRGFDLLANQTSVQAERLGLGVVVIFIDIDGLKEINDRHGHDAGDLAIKQVAHMLRSQLRAADVVARFGGDEFVVLAVGHEERAEERLMSQIGEALDQLNRSREFPVSLSYGSAVREHAEADYDIEGLIGRADSAMYRMKKLHCAQRDA